MGNDLFFGLLALASMVGAVGAFVAAIAVRRLSLLGRRRLAYAGILLMAAAAVMMVASTSALLAKLF